MIEALAPVAALLISVSILLTGFCFAVLYVVIESWLDERSSNENRGVVFSTYAMITLTVLAAGQMMALQEPAARSLFTAIVHVTLIGYITVRFLRRRTHAKKQIACGDALSAAQTASQVFEEEIHPQPPDERP